LLPSLATLIAAAANPDCRRRQSENPLGKFI
jgi:hypothetical protein